jgi:hypothetical protein
MGYPNNKKVIDPLQFAKLCWPDVQFYDKQREVIYSVCNNTETVAVAGNMLGKDFVAGFIALWFFISRQPCRIVTTSVKDAHLDVLWGEMKNYIQTSIYDLSLEVTADNIYKLIDGHRCPISYVKRLVSSADTVQSFQGHHVAQIGDSIPKTLVIGDEASALSDAMYDMVRPWANRRLWIGNPWDCSNFFYRAVMGGVTP